jgi:hypothetical protein
MEIVLDANAVPTPNKTATAATTSNPFGGPEVRFRFGAGVSSSSKRKICIDFPLRAFN